MPFNSSGSPSTHEDGNYALSLSQGLASVSESRSAPVFHQVHLIQMGPLATFRSWVEF